MMKQAWAEASAGQNFCPLLTQAVSSIVVPSTWQVNPGTVKPVQVEQATWQLSPLAEAAVGQNCLSTPPSVAQVVSFAGTHWPGVDGAAVLFAQSAQLAEQSPVLAQKFLESVAQLAASAAHVLPSTV